MDGIEKMSCEYKVVFYQRSNGSEPAREFIDSLSPKMTAKMIRTIELLQINGPDLREPYSKKLVDGIFELRVRIGNDITRVLYFFYHDRNIILTNGFIKKTRKTPDNELNLAKKYRDNFLLGVDIND